MFIIEFWVIWVVPPAGIMFIVRPFSTSPVKKIVVRTIFRSISSYGIAIFFIKTLSVKPFIKSSTVVEYASSITFIPLL